MTTPHRRHRVNWQDDGMADVSACDGTPGAILVAPNGPFGDGTPAAHSWTCPVCNTALVLDWSVRVVPLAEFVE